MYKPKIAIIDNEAETVNSLHSLLYSEGCQIDTYPTAEAFLAILHVNHPNCLIVEVRMPHISGFELQQILKSQNIHIPTIFITAHGDIEMAVRAMQEGALHFLTKPINYQTLLETIHTAIRLDNRRQTIEKEAKRFQAKLKCLTPREHEVMQLMIKGKLTKLIADELNISISTAELYRAKIKKKMGASSLAELVYASTRHGFI
jgi:two-component system response regulator FixJ